MAQGMRQLRQQRQPGIGAAVGGGSEAQVQVGVVEKVPAGSQEERGSHSASTPRPPPPPPHRMSLRSPNMCGKVSGKAGAACTGAGRGATGTDDRRREGRRKAGERGRHACVSWDGPASWSSWQALRGARLRSPRRSMSAMPTIQAPFSPHLDRGERNLADVVVRGEAKDALHLVHGHAPGGGGRWGAVGATATSGGSSSK